MHQVYDDEMTFKLVAAASSVSGLPVEVCLEEFGKHFLVYCQKNGYDQILRVLGSNLYDFLTNLDNLHDHLASIYPGMRAPSFRVTRHLNATGQHKGPLPPAPQLIGCKLREQVSLGQLLASAAEPGGQTNGPANGSDELHKQNASCSLAGSMYLHYYSERAGLSPIVKGLVMAVAREFFQTDIVVTECELAPSEQPPLDDHVVLKIDRRAREETAPGAAAAAAATATDSAAGTGASAAASPQAESSGQQTEAGLQHYETTSHAQQLIQSETMLNIYDSLSTNARDSLVNSEIMMQTFPFHVIFDRQFKLVQVGKSLLRVTSSYWRRRAEDCARRGQAVDFNDLFRIVRPKIEVTFDAIADHTNQVFVVRTRPLVLNADQRRSKRRSCPESTGEAAKYEIGAEDRSKVELHQSGNCVFGQRVASTSDSLSSPRKGSMCPLDGLARQRRRSSLEHLHEGAQVGQGQRRQQQQLDELGDPMNHVSLRLKGQMIILSGGQLCLYLCSPRVDHLDQLLACGVQMSDLALHDRTRELILMSHTHKEDREAVKKLDQASNDLKKMDTKLRQENKRTNEVLHNIFPAKIATLLSHGHKVESESFDLVTCLYSDIIGFTKMCGSENVKPIDIVRLLNTLYLQFDNLTNIHGVFKVETIGDAYVVVGGLPEPVEDHADRCVKMGLDMVKVIATVRSPADNQPIQVGSSWRLLALIVCFSFAQSAHQQPVQPAEGRRVQGCQICVGPLLSPLPIRPRLSPLAWSGGRASAGLRCQAK